MSEEKRGNSKTATMIFFITFLRALAACLITNAHYTGIYPTDIIANGGLIGDVLFFAVSGYCLFNIKSDLSFKGFAGWYGKRIMRVYPPVLIMTAVFMVLGAYSLSEHSFIWWFIYPTYYHFVASIIILYIPFFFIVKIPMLKEKITLIMIVIAVVWLVVYFTIYNHSYYHIDTVREPMIRFLFMESMLLGAWFKKRDNELRNKLKLVYPIVVIITFIFYFACKLLFTKKPEYASLQFLNQIAIFVLLFFLFRTFCGLDEKLEKIPVFLKKIISFLADMTLEIYVVQYVIIAFIRNMNIVFPLNWIVLTLSILISAFILHKVCQVIYKVIDKILIGRKIV